MSAPRWSAAVAKLWPHLVQEFEFGIGNDAVSSWNGGSNRVILAQTLTFLNPSHKFPSLLMKLGINSLFVTHYLLSRNSFLLHT
jgi:hypothetical protein